MDYFFFCTAFTEWVVPKFIAWGIRETKFSFPELQIPPPATEILIDAPNWKRLKSAYETTQIDGGRFIGGKSSTNFTKWELEAPLFLWPR